MTHGHELKGGNAGGRGDAGWRGIKGRKKWDSCNSIINKIYLKQVKQRHTHFFYIDGYRIVNN